MNQATTTLTRAAGRSTAAAYARECFRRYSLPQADTLEEQRDGFGGIRGGILPVWEQETRARSMGYGA